MGFVTPTLLGGALLVGVPIVLHLIMRREAQKLRFPALRFIEQRRTLNQHRLRLRHLLLLALRCAVIALLALALARPTLRGSGAAGKEDAAIASVLVFDNSMRMGYEHANQSRLDRAKELAAWLLEQIPTDGPVTVVDRSGRQRGQDIDHTAAELRVERLELSPQVRPMEEALRDATRWLEEKKEYRGEIYVFTDLAAEAWPEAMRGDLAKRLDELPGTNVYLIDVGVEESRNVGLGPLRLSSERLTPASVLRLEADLLNTGAQADDDNSGDKVESTAKDVAVELFVGAGSGEPEKRGQQVISLAGERQPLEFSLSGLELGSHQGFVQIIGSDGLPADDARYFSVDVRPPSKILLLGEEEFDTLFLREALAPSAAGAAASRFTCEEYRFSQIGELPLADFAAICLVDPPPLPAAAWQTLTDYAETGGGVGIFLGRRARRDEMNRPEAQRLLPARLRWQSHDTTYVRPVAVEHPALAELRELADTVPWSEFPVFKYWELEAGAESAHVVASFANGKPALVERQIGDGRVLMLTTPVSDPAYDDPWNLLPTAPEPWPFLALANGTVDYLAAIGEAQLNYTAGQTVVLRLAPEEQVESYVLMMPDGSAVRQTLAANDEELTIAAAEALGNYRVRAGGRLGKLDRGFSVNLPSEVTRLERASPAELVESLGKERTRIARTRQEIEVRVGLGRLGRELFPALILAVALVLAGEQLLANRFYAGAASRAAPSETSRSHAPGESSRFHAPRGNDVSGRSAAKAEEPVGYSV